MSDLVTTSPDALAEDGCRSHWAVCDDCLVSICVEAHPDRGRGPLPDTDEWDVGHLTCPLCGDWLTIEGSDLTTTWQRADSQRKRHAAEAAAAREVEVRVETWDAALRWVRQWAEAASPEAAIKNIDRAEPFNPYRAALAPADNDGEASRG